MQEFNGRTVLLYIDTTTSVSTPGNQVTTADAILVACLTGNTFDGSTSAISTTSKCSGQFASSIGGEQSWTMGGEGNSVTLDPSEVGVIASHNALFKLWRSGNPFWAFQYDTQLDTVRYGVVRIDSDGESYPDNAQSTFSLSFTGIGEPFDQDDLAS